MKRKSLVLYGFLVAIAVIFLIIIIILISIEIYNRDELSNEKLWTITFDIFIIMVLSIFKTYFINPFVKNNEEHTNKILKAIREYIEKVEITINDKKHVKISYKDGYIESTAEKSLDNYNHWKDFQQHINTGNDYQTTKKMLKNLRTLKSTANDETDKTLEDIYNIVEGKIKIDYPQFEIEKDFSKDYKTNLKNIIFPTNIVELIWDKNFELFNGKTLNSPKVKMIPYDFQIGKYNEIWILYYTTPTVIIKDLDLLNEERFKTFLSDLINNQKIKKDIESIFVQRNNVNIIFNNWINELEKISQKIESNKEIDGDCDFCPTLI